MASAVAPPVTPKTTTSVDPLYSQALAQAKAALSAETAPIQAEQAASDAQFQARQTDATNSAAAVSDLLKGIGPAANSEYQTGAQNVELAANGFSQGMQDALQGNTNNLNAMLQKLGSPAQLDSHAAQSGDVLYALHGYNPGTTFSKQGANLGAAADLQAGTALMKGQENVKALQGQAIVADQGFQAKIAEMAGKLPGDTQTNYQHLQTLALNDAKFREQVRRDNIDQAYKAASLKLSQAKYSSSVQEFNARQAQQLSIASARLAQQKYISDRNYSLSLARLGIQQARLQQTIVANSFKAANGGLTKVQVTKYASQAESIALEAYNGKSKVTVVGGKPTQTPGVGAVSYNEALSRELKTGMPVQMALDALDRVYPPDMRPDDAHLAQMLGSLDPSLVQSVAAGAKAVQTANNAMTNGPVANVTGKAGTVVDTAKTMLGTPYVWGGNTPGQALDCSGFICQVFKQVGINLPRTTYQMVKAGKPVSLKQLQPGDLVFTEPTQMGPGHVGLYVGNGQIQESPHTGTVNSYIPLQSFLGDGFVAARRVLPTQQ